MFTLDMPFLASELSDNIGETPEGFLVCNNVPIARTGVQEYYGHEIGLTGGEANQVVKVYRLAEDVFNQQAMASFEGKTFTINHPNEAVGPDNFRNFISGHLQNVRSKGDKYLLGDIVVKDPQAIDEIKTKRKREISCGYECTYVPYKDGYRQVNIRGNHVALVECGRAGAKVSVKDELKNPIVNTNRSIFPMNKNQAIAAALLSAAKDPNMTADTLANMMTALQEDDKKQQAHDESAMAKLLKMFSAKTKDEDKEEEKTEDVDTTGQEEMEKKEDVKDAAAIQKMINKAVARALKVHDEELEAEKTEDDEIEKMLSEDSPDPMPEATEGTYDEEGEAEEEKEKIDAKDFMSVLLKDMKPVLAKLPSKQQQLVKDALLKSYRTNIKGTNNYFGIKKAINSHVKDAETKVATADSENLGDKYAKMYNPHSQDKAATNFAQ